MSIGCPDCGIVEDLPPLPPHSTAECVRCGTGLERSTGRSISAALACSAATFLLLVPANALPLLRVDLFSMHGETRIVDGVRMLWGRDWILLAGLSAIMVTLLPFARFGFLSAVLGALQLGLRPKWLGRVFRWSIWLDPWAMPDVFLLASCVGYFRLNHIAEARLSVLPGGYCFVAAALLTMLSRAVLDRRTVWRAIGGERTRPVGELALSCVVCDLVLPAHCEGARCPRCAERVHARKPYAMLRTTALVAAAFILLFPSNLLPMNVSHQLGHRQTYRIFDGIIELFKNGLWPLGAIIFCTSILIPFGKILVLAWCLVSTWRGWTEHLLIKTSLARAAAEIGRWSNTDPFAIVFFVPLMDFGAFASANAGWGATAFILMTTLTLTASKTFDTRLMWDRVAAP